MKSMTGFGRGHAQAGRRRLLVEVRTTNHRGFDLKIRGRDLGAACEFEVGKALRAAIERGAVLLLVREEEGDDVPALDRHKLGELHASLEVLRSQLNIAQRVDLATLAAYLPFLGGTSRVEVEWEVLKPGLDEALRGLLDMRSREGQVLRQDLAHRAARLRGLVGQVAQAAAQFPSKAKERLQQRIASLGAGLTLDPARLAQEVALLADKAEITEELVRLNSHLDQLDAMVDGKPGKDKARAIGRTLDFLVQELGREINTIGSKVQDAGVAALVIDGKAELEKIREQAQNIE